MLKQLKENLHRHMKTKTLGKNFIIESEVYTDQQRFEREMETLRDCPQALGPLEELKNSRSYIFHGERIYHNTCPHRGARLNKTKEGFVCSYHGWSFDGEGKLSHTTGPQCPYPDGSLRLKELTTTIEGGMVFTGESAYHQEINALSAQYHYLETRTHQIRCNWKFLAESLLETYHFPFAHARFLASFENAFYSQGSSLGKDARIIVPLSDFEQARHEDNLNGINIMHYVFPYSFVLFMSSGFVWFRIVPKEVGQSLFEYSLFSYGLDDEAAKRSLSMLNLILDEDFTIVEGQQVNAILKQRYHFTGYEKLIQHMHRQVTEMIN